MANDLLNQLLSRFPNASESIKAQWRGMSTTQRQQQLNTLGTGGNPNYGAAPSYGEGPGGGGGTGTTIEGNNAPAKGGQIPDYSSLYGPQLNLINQAWKDTLAANDKRLTDNMMGLGFDQAGNVNANVYGEYQMNRRTGGQEQQAALMNSTKRGIGTAGLGAQMGADLRFNRGAELAGITSRGASLISERNIADQAATTLKGSQSQSAMDTARDRAISEGLFGTPGTPTYQQEGGVATPPGLPPGGGTGKAAPNALLEQLVSRNIVDRKTALSMSAAQRLARLNQANKTRK